MKLVKLLSRVWLFVTPWTVAYQASLSMGCSRQEYWSGLPFLSVRYLHIRRWIINLTKLQKTQWNFWEVSGITHVKKEKNLTPLIIKMRHNTKWTYLNFGGNIYTSLVYSILSYFPMTERVASLEYDQESLSKRRLCNTTRLSCKMLCHLYHLI